MFVKLDPVWRKIFGELSTNLAVFWFGAALLSLAQFAKPFWSLVLITNIANGIVCLLVAYQFSK